ncbi:MAG: hypothetical protein LAT54_03100 [Cryomorphaceae bacterium]|nr:hypothetical protein [Cryomorphaceae bacterium]
MKVYLRRFFYFGIGVFFGTLIVYALFGDRDIQCSYFPNDRVLYDMRKKELKASPFAMCQMECYQFNDSLFDNVLREAKINFKQSQAKEDILCKKYPLTWKDTDGQVWQILTQNCKEELRILSVVKAGSEVTCTCP